MDEDSLKVAFDGLAKSMEHMGVKPIKGRWATPEETPCPSCGRTDGWQNTGGRLFPDHSFYCVCGHGTYRYPGLWEGIDQEVFYGIPACPKVWAVGKAYDEALGAWQCALPYKYDGSAWPKTVTVHCVCGQAVTLLKDVDARPEYYPDDEMVSHEGNCSCGVRCMVYIPPTPRPEYESEYAAWIAAEPKSPSWEPVRWIEEVQEVKP